MSDNDKHKNQDINVNAMLEITERLATFEPPVQKRIVDQLSQYVREDKLSTELSALKARLQHVTDNGK